MGQIVFIDPVLDATVPTSAIIRTGERAILSLAIYPAIYVLWRWWADVRRANASRSTSPGTDSRVPPRRIV